MVLKDYQETQRFKMKVLKIVFTFQIWLSKRAIIIHWKIKRLIHLKKCSRNIISNYLLLQKTVNLLWIWMMILEKTYLKKIKIQKKKLKKIKYFCHLILNLIGFLQMNTTKKYSRDQNKTPLKKLGNLLLMRLYKKFKWTKMKFARNYRKNSNKNLKNN